MDADGLPGLHALLYWRTQLLHAGFPDDALPAESDLRRIAQHPGRSPLGRLGLVRPDAVRRFEPGIVNTLRTATRPATGTSPARAPVGSSRRSRAAAAGHHAATDERVPPGNAPATPTDEPVHFSPRDLSAGPATPRMAMRSLSIGDSGEVVVRWDPVDAGTDEVLYRVITSDRHMPYSPESGDMVAVTRATEVVDRRRFTGPLRHVQVWVNRGGSPDACRKAQPELLCADSVVAPVHNVDLREDHGSVSCTWDEVPAGITRVEVLRVPEADAGRRGYLRQYLITRGQQCRTGFQDAECVQGETYEYRIFTVAVVDGHERMSGVSRKVRISAPLQPVADLEATPRIVDERTVVDLTWTSPGRARVHIYRTQIGPEPGAEEGPIPTSALATARLPEVARLNQPVQHDGTVSRLVAVPWPDGWPSAYFTPVSVDEGQARIGRSKALTHAGAIRDVRLVQRVDWQQLTFDWPSGAAQVQVFITARGVPLADPPGEPGAQIGRAAYETNGGLRLRGVLPPEGCDLHIVPVSFYGGQIVRGSGVTVIYDGLSTLWYTLAFESRVKGRFLGGRPKRVLEIWSGHAMVSTPRLVLVHNEQRLPLDPHDGRQILVAQGPTHPGQWTVLERFDAEPSKPGFFRLFADVDPAQPRQFAVLDPPLDYLRGAP